MMDSALPLPWWGITSLSWVSLPKKGFSGSPLWLAPIPVFYSGIHPYNLKYLSSPDFIIRYDPLSDIVGWFLGGLGVAQIDNQATILSLVLQNRKYRTG